MALSSSKIKDIVQNMLLVVVSLIMFFGACELTARLLSPKPKASGSSLSAFIDDPVLDYVGRPDYKGWKGHGETGRWEVRHNARGLRDHNDYGAKSPDVFRILGIGDSFTWGDACPYKDTYLRVAEKKINESVSGKVEIVKAGYPGYTLPQEVLFFKIHGKTYNPDLVTIGFLANDLVSVYPLTDDRMALQKPDDDDGMGLLDPPLPMKIAMFLGAHSKFYHWMKSLLLKNDKLYARAYLARGGEDSYVSPNWSPRYIEAMEQVRHLLLDLKQEVEQIDARLLLIFIPQRFQLLVEKSPALKKKYQADKINQYIEAFCREAGIFYLDTFPALLEASRQAPVFYPIDGHLNPRGYRIAGDTLADYLIREKLISNSRDSQRSLTPNRDDVPPK